MTLDRDRPRWDWTALERVGPLRFGMTTHQVAAALHGEVPTNRRGWHQWSQHGAYQWYSSEERFDKAGVSAHYWYPDGVPALAAVTVHGRTGPQVEWDGIPLIGRKVSEVGAEVIRHIEEHGLGRPGPLRRRSGTGGAQHVRASHPSRRHRRQRGPFLRTGLGEPLTPHGWLPGPLR